MGGELPPEGAHTPYDLARGVVRGEAKADEALVQARGAATAVAELEPRVEWIEDEIRLAPGPQRARGYETKVGVMWDDHRDRAAQRRLLIAVASFVGFTGLMQLAAVALLLARIGLPGS